jgi:hypothetical protein
VKNTPFNLLYPGGLMIEPGISESDAAAHAARPPRDMRTGYIWYDLPTAVIEDHEICLSLCFFKSKLDMISLGIVDPRYGTTWSEMTEEKERARAAATRDWLERIGFPTGSYPWGEVWAGLDTKNGDGCGVIRFK